MQIDILFSIQIVWVSNKQTDCVMDNYVSESFQFILIYCESFAFLLIVQSTGSLTQ